MRYAPCIFVITVPCYLMNQKESQNAMGSTMAHTKNGIAVHFAAEAIRKQRRVVIAANTYGASTLNSPMERYIVTTAIQSKICVNRKVA